MASILSDQQQTSGKCSHCGAPTNDPQRCSSCGYDCLAPVRPAAPTEAEVLQAKRRATEKELGLPIGAFDALAKPPAKAAVIPISLPPGPPIIIVPEPEPVVAEGQADPTAPVAAE